MKKLIAWFKELRAPRLRSRYTVSDYDGVVATLTNPNDDGFWVEFDLNVTANDAAKINRIFSQAFWWSNAIRCAETDTGRVVSFIPALIMNDDESEYIDYLKDRPKQIRLRGPYRFTKIQLEKSVNDSIAMLQKTAPRMRCPTVDFSFLCRTARVICVSRTTQRTSMGRIHAPCSCMICRLCSGNLNLAAQPANKLLRAYGKDFNTNRTNYNIGTVKLDDLANTSDWYNLYAPVLSLCEPGFYFVTCSNYFPVDCAGHIFWGDRAHARAQQLAISLNSVRPHFLVASQSPDKFSAERFARAKETFFATAALAYHLVDELSVVLDGHHRALAAATNGCSIACVTIARCLYNYDAHDREMPKSILSTFGPELSAEALSQEARAWLHKRPARSAEVENPNVAVVATPASEEFASVLAQAERQRDRYPTLDMLESERAIGAIADLDLAKKHSSPEAEIILDALIVREDERARAFALLIISNEANQFLWATALRYLSQFKDKEVADCFWALEIRNDIKRREVLDVVHRYIVE